MQKVWERWTPKWKNEIYSKLSTPEITNVTFLSIFFFPMNVHKNKMGLCPTHTVWLALGVNLSARRFYTWVFFTPNSLLVTVGDTMRGMGSFPCPQEPVVWVRDHLSGILLSSMVTGVLALCLSPAADTGTASEFFHQEKKNHSSPHPFQIDLSLKGSTVSYHWGLQGLLSVGMWAKNPYT